MATATDNVVGPGIPALARDLKKLVLDLMLRRLEQMFEGADGVLMAMAERSRNPAEQRRNFDTRQLVRQHRKAILQVFSDQLVAGFLPGAEVKRKSEGDVSFEELRLSQTRTIEESIAVNNIALKAENLNEQPLREIGQRLDWLIHERGAPISPAALSPSTLCDAFRVSTQSLNLEFQTELLIYKLFDKLVVPSLNEVYAESLKLLEVGGATALVVKHYHRPGAAPPALSKGHGSGAPSSPIRPGTGAGTAGPQGGGALHPGSATGPRSGMTGGFSAMPGDRGMRAGGSGGMQPVSAQYIPAGEQVGIEMPGLDSRTLNSLRSVQGGPAAIAASYSDAELAIDLSQAASGHAVVGWGAPQARASLQCADLVGRMFNGILEDSSVPQELKPQLDELRFSVIKSAMSDRTFFANADHPVRRLVNELATMAAAARTTGAGSIGQLTELVAMIQSQFQVAAKSVKAAAATAVPLTEADAERFIDDQLVQGRARRQALIDKARQVVQEEMQLRLTARKIPEQARPLLFTGLAPLLGLSLLRHGMDSEGWRVGMLLVQKVMDAVDPAAGTALDAAQLEPLCAQLDLDLAAAGMVPTRTTELLSGLRQGFEAAQREWQAAPPVAPAAQEAAESVAPAAPATASPPIAQLLRLLASGAWFKVRDAELKQTRWLKVAGTYLADERPEYRGRVAFSEFSGQNTLLVTVDDLLDQMVAGLTEPFDQSPAAKAALAGLIAQQQAVKAAAAKRVH